uniref:Drosophila Cc gene from dopa decarboxylase gene cluster; mapping 2.0 kb from the 5'end of Ddc protein n=1 Tax=Drosophila melanogaster TaxID=7227 RepID=V9H1B9_DROME|nr:Cc gene smaller hypothetical protein - fruit fly (Drosophila melanogaster) [Drosophila melanogaster]CAA27805.1 URF 1 [Drosophila melanogaster]CAA27808.1 unnamed protein product [Drosophila melanogaster]
MAAQFFNRIGQMGSEWRFGWRCQFGII